MSTLRNNKILLAVVVAAVAAAAFWYLVLSPKRTEAADLESQIAAKQAELETARQQVATYERARVSYRASYATLARLGKAVPADDDIRSLLVQLDVAAHRTNVDFAGFELGGTVGGTSSSSSSAPATAGPDGLAPPPGAVPVGTTGISAMPFNLTFDGSYFNLTDFLSRLDRFVAVHNEHMSATGRLLRLETISFAPTSAGYPHVKAQVKAASYLVAPTATDSATPTTPAPATGTPATTTPSTPSTTTATITGAAR